MLPNAALKPWYDRVVWLFVSRNFKEDAKDREALRTHDRFGISSWPQMIVFDPIDDRVLLDPPRDLKGFVRAFERATAQTKGRAPGAGITAAHRALADLAEGDARPALLRLDDANPVVRAGALEELAASQPVPAEAVSKAAAILAEPDQDVVVYLRALRLCAKQQPERVLRRARALLAIDNDPLRYEVLQLIAAQPQPALAPVLDNLFAAAGREVASRNPNVLRMRTAACLGASGDAGSIDAMAELARRADWRNGTTRVVIEALLQLGKRLPKERERVQALLLESFPPAVATSDAQATRASLALARSVATAVGSLRSDAEGPALPSQWDEPARTAYLDGLRRALR